MLSGLSLSIFLRYGFGCGMHGYLMLGSNMYPVVRKVSSHDGVCRLQC